MAVTYETNHISRKSNGNGLNRPSTSELEMKILGNLKQYTKSKHIEVLYHFIKGCIEDRTLTVNFIGTDEQLADIFTKALGRRFHLLPEKIKVVEVQ